MQVPTLSCSDTYLRYLAKTVEIAPWNAFCALVSAAVALPSTPCVLTFCFSRKRRSYLCRTWLAGASSLSSSSPCIEGDCIPLKPLDWSEDCWHRKGGYCNTAFLLQGALATYATFLSARDQLSDPWILEEQMATLWCGCKQGQSTQHLPECSQTFLSTSRVGLAAIQASFSGW